MTNRDERGRFTKATDQTDPAVETPESDGAVTKRPRRMGELGVYGLKQNAGYVAEEYLPELRGQKGARFYREMSDNSPVIGGLVLGYREVAMHLDWHIEEPEEPSAADAKATEFIQDCFDDMEHSFESFLSQALSEIVYGWALHEIVYKRREDGRIGWARLPIRAQESLDHWEFGPHGTIKAMYQTDPENGKLYKIPLSKALLFRTTQMKNNPEGVSMLRPAVVPYQYLRRIQEYEAIGVERDLAGLPVAYVPNEWLTSDDPKTIAVRDQMIQMVKDVRNNERAGLVLPRIYHEDLTSGAIDRNLMFDFELLASSGSRQFDTDKIITRYAQQVAMSLLGDFVTLGHDGVGSYSLGAVKMDLWVMVVDSICKGIAEEFTRAIKDLLDLNGLKYDKAPVLSYGQVTNVDLAALVAYVKGLSDAGILTPDEGTEAWLREQGGLPQLDPSVEPIYERMPIDPLTGLPVDDIPRDPKTGLELDPDTGAPKGLADAERRRAEAEAAAAEHAAKNPPRDPNDPEVIEAKKPAPPKPKGK